MRANTVRLWAAEPPQFKNAIDDPMGQQKSVVYDIHGKYVVRGTKVHIPSVRLMFDTALRHLTGQTDTKKAWREFIHDDDTIALVFSRIGAKQIGTNRDVAAGLLQSLYRADFKPQRIMLVGLDELPDNAQGTIPWKYGWQEEKVDFGSGKDYLASWLDRVTAIINVPMVMDDNIIGLRCALANMSLPLIKSPARLNRYMRPELHNQGDPFIPEIYELPQIKGKVRLHLVNALRILYYGGPEVSQVYVREPGIIIASTDPVALDRRVLELLLKTRRENPMPRGADITIQAPYLATAQAMNLGYNDLNFIKYAEFNHDKR